MYFDQLPLDDTVLDALDAMNFEQCTPIQEQAIPPLLEGHDLIGVAQTGTGKTAAYLLPILNELCTGHYPQDAINCLIMAPTRELAQQIDQQVEAFSYFMLVSSVAVYGGNDGIRYEQERRGLTLGADIIIATPGRLISHLATGNIDFSRITFFVLDEADRMLDMGFYDDIMKITSYLPPQRQTIMFSATMPEDIQRLANNILNHPVEIKIAVSKPAEKIRQIAYICYDGMKDSIVRSIVEHCPFEGSEDESVDRVIIFCAKKTKVRELGRTFRMKGLYVGAMHSDLNQKERDEIMRDFRNGHINILIATDIVSRGIDIDDIQMVINYDTPRDPEDYVHRIGRTARANRNGMAVTLVTERDYPNLIKIERLIEREIPKPDLPEGCGEKPDISHPASQRRFSQRKKRVSRFSRKKSSTHNSTPEDATSDHRHRKYSDQGSHSHRHGGQRLKKSR